MPLPQQSERNVEVKDYRVRCGSVTFQESSAKENNSSPNSQTKTLNETQGLFMTKLKESFIYCCKVVQKIVSIKFTATVLGIYRKFEKTLSILTSH